MVFHLSLLLYATFLHTPTPVHGNLSYPMRNNQKLETYFTTKFMVMVKVTYKPTDP